MSSFSGVDLALLGYLVPAAQRLIKQSMEAYIIWFDQLSDHERDLLVRWRAHQSNKIPELEVNEPKRG